MRLSVQNIVPSLWANLKHRSDRSNSLSSPLSPRHHTSPTLMVKSGTQSSISLSPPSHLPPRNIVVTGEIGTGKSSFINLVTDGTVAEISSDACGFTTRSKSYHWETPDHIQKFQLWETPGLNESSCNDISLKNAQDELRTLLGRLSKRDGVHLLILCMRGAGHITEGMHQTYDAVLRIRDQMSSHIPIVAVISGIESRHNEDDIASSMETWWSENTADLCKKMFHGRVCLTTLSDDCHPPMQGRYAVSQRLARNLLTDHALPHAALTRNVVVVGHTGAGKSSVINLVIGTDSAVATNNARAVTSSTSYHDWIVFQTQTFRLWDTPGFGEDQDRSTHAYNAVRSLLTQLGGGPGVHLLMICFQGRCITKSMKQAYSSVIKLRDSLCPNAPLVAVVTGLESTSGINTPDILAAMEQWWPANFNNLSDDEPFSGHACITTLADDAHPPMPGRRDECQRFVRDLVIDHTLTPPSVSAPDLHVILFGETGVGKSSLVNLLAGYQAAEVSPDSTGCTLQSTEHQFQLGATTIRLWDTIGLGGPENANTSSCGHTGAIEKAVELVKRLSASGGINLFLFCIRAGRVTAIMQSNYRLFYEVLGKKQVPIALVVTHLECEPDKMEDWWTRNAKNFESHGIHVNECMCITTLDQHPRHVESQGAVRKLLCKYADQAKFVMPSEKWLARLLSGLGFGLPKGKELVRVLTKRCHLEPSVAQTVATCIENKTDT